MGLFGFGKKTNEGGLMDAIRLGEVKDYLIYKWRPEGEDAGSTKKENAIRTGSSLLVNEGQAAMFIYANEGGKSDVIVGPYNKTIDTGNFPVLTNIIGAAFGGGTPFQAQIYFITLQEAMQVKFTIPWFNVAPSQQAYMTYDVPVAIDGSLMFNAAPSEGQLKQAYMIDRQQGFTQLPYEEYRTKALEDAVRTLFRSWGGKDTTMKYLKEKLEDMITAAVKNRFANLPPEVFVLHLNKLIMPFSQFIYQSIYADLRDTFGIWPTRLNITDIRFDESDKQYQLLRRVTTGTSFNISMKNEENVLSQLSTDAAVRNGLVARQAEIQMDHQEDMLGRMREEAQFAQHTQTEATAHRTNLSSEQAYLGAHTVNVQGAVMQTGMESLGNMSAMNMGAGGGAMNPAAMMMGMGMASGMAGQMGNMMGNMGNAFNNQVAMGGAPTPPPMPGQTPPAPPTQQAAAYFVLVNNQQMGPCDLNSLRQMAQAGQINAQTMAWAQGMPQWTAMGSIPALASVFQAQTATPPTPPTPGSVPPPPPAM